MKKLFFVLAAGALMMVSCNSGLSPEGQKAWDNFKQLAATFESEEAIEANYADEASFKAGHEAFVEATKKIQDYVLEITPEQADSFKTMCEACAPVIQKANEMLQAKEEIEAAAEEPEEAAEEVEE